jgi:hypothetical protein
MTSNIIYWKYIKDDILSDPDVKAEYDRLQPEFDIAGKIIVTKNWVESKRVYRKS